MEREKEKAREAVDDFFGDGKGEEDSANYPPSSSSSSFHSPLCLSAPSHGFLSPNPTVKLTLTHSGADPSDLPSSETAPESSSHARLAEISILKDAEERGTGGARREEKAERKKGFFRRETVGEKTDRGEEVKKEKSILLFPFRRSTTTSSSPSSSLLSPSSSSPSVSVRRSPLAADLSSSLSPPPSSTTPSPSFSADLAPPATSPCNSHSPSFSPSPSPLSFSQKVDPKASPLPRQQPSDSPSRSPAKEANGPNPKSAAKMNKLSRKFSTSLSSISSSSLPSYTSSAACQSLRVRCRVPELHECRHLLARAIVFEMHNLTLLASAHPSSLYSSGVLGTPMDELCERVMRMHGDPVNLFLFYLSEEIDKVRTLPTVMREQSLSVRVLQFIWKAYDGGRVLLHFRKFVRSLRESHVAILKDDERDVKKRQKFKAKILSAVSALFSASALPLPICVLCFRTNSLISSRLSQLDLSGVRDLSEWTVASLVFLRFLVPSIAQYASDGTLSEGSQKAAMEMSRVMMKLCSGTRFKDSQFSNDILSELSPLYASFCTEILSVGSASADADIAIISKDVTEAEERMRTMEDRKILDEFLSTYGIFLPRTCRKMLEKDREREREREKGGEGEGEGGEGEERGTGEVVEALVERLKTRLSSDPLA